MKDPKVGERVAVYGSSKLQACIGAVSKNGVINAIHDQNWLEIKLDGDGGYTFHHKQCRRLVKKRRRIWINEYSNGLNQVWHSSAEEARLSQAPGCTIICREFVEVKRKK